MHARSFHLRLRPSRLLRTVVSIAHLASVAVVLSTEPGRWVGAAALACIAASAVAGRPGRRDRVTGVDVEPGRLRVHVDGAPDDRAAVVGATVVHPWLIVLCVRHADGARARLAILPDMAAEPGLRRLRVWLAAPGNGRSRDGRLL